MRNQSAPLAVMLVVSAGCLSNNTNISPAEVRAIKTLQPLSEHLARDPLGHAVSLDLSGLTITDAMLVHVGQLHNLRELALHGNSCSVFRLNKLSGLKQLRALSLAWTPISTEDIEAVASQFPQLLILDLNHTNIDDRSIEYLSTMDKLEHLYINRTLISQEGVRNLRRILIRCQVQDE